MDKIAFDPVVDEIVTYGKMTIVSVEDDGVEDVKRLLTTRLNRMAGAAGNSDFILWHAWRVYAQFNLTASFEKNVYEPASAARILRSARGRAGPRPAGVLRRQQQDPILALLPACLTTASCVVGTRRVVRARREGHRTTRRACALRAAVPSRTEPAARWPTSAAPAPNRAASSSRSGGRAPVLVLGSLCPPVAPTLSRAHSAIRLC